MAISVVTLKTGDRVISELKEIFEGEEDKRRGVCLLMEDPYILSMDGATPQYLAEWNTKLDFLNGIHTHLTGNIKFHMIW